MKIELYTRNNCSACTTTKKLLTERELPYVEYVLERDIKREEVIEKFPGTKHLPVIVVDGIQIGNREYLSIYLDKQAS